MVGIDPLLLCADALVFRHWHHGPEMLADAEIEMGVTYELYECDRAGEGSADTLDAYSILHVAAFFDYLARHRDMSIDGCLDELPREDWPLVWIRYQSNLLRAFAFERPAPSAMFADRLTSAILAF